MRHTTLLASLTVLGVLLWLSSRVVDSQPAYAAAAVLTVLVFSAGASRPNRY